MKFETCRLGDISDIVDSLHKTPKYADKGKPMVRVTDVKYGPLRLDSTYKVDDKVFEEFSRRYSPSVGDIVITRVGSYGNTAYVTDPDFCLGQNTAAVIPKINPRYLYLVLNSRQLKEQIEFSTVGSTQKTLSLKAIFNLQIPRFTAEFEDFVAKTCGQLDDKIQLNHQINQTLEQMAQAIFKSWFVDFEPVKAKIAAKESWQALQAEGEAESLPDLETWMNLAAMQVISGQTEAALNQMADQQPEQFSELFKTAALFPAAMQDSELGEIPEGWEATTLGAEFDITMGQSPPGDTYNEVGEGVAFFQGRRDFGVRFPKNRVYCSAPKRMAKASDTLLSVRAPVGDVNIAGSSCCIGRGLAALRHKSGCSSFTYYSALELGSQLASYDSEGTVFGSINQKNLKALDFKKPLPILVKCFSNFAKSLDEKIFTLSLQIQTLESVRDTLLPKLLSGELSVADLELVGEA